LNVSRFSLSRAAIIVFTCSSMNLPSVFCYLGRVSAPSSINFWASLS
jgi:hypothetical protein